jgi:hypothetical protein
LAYLLLLIPRLGPSALGGSLLVQEGLNPGDVAAHCPHPRRVLQLTVRLLESQVERFLLQADEISLELIRRLGEIILWFDDTFDFMSLSSIYFAL